MQTNSNEKAKSDIYNHNKTTMVCSSQNMLTQFRKHSTRKENVWLPFFLYVEFNGRIFDKEIKYNQENRYLLVSFLVSNLSEYLFWKKTRIELRATAGRMKKKVFGYFSLRREVNLEN